MWGGPARPGPAGAAGRRRRRAGGRPAARSRSPGAAGSCGACVEQTEQQLSAAAWRGSPVPSRPVPSRRCEPPAMGRLPLYLCCCLGNSRPAPLRSGRRRGTAGWASPCTARRGGSGRPARPRSRFSLSSLSPSAAAQRCAPRRRRNPSTATAAPRGAATPPPATCSSAAPPASPPPPPAASASPSPTASLATSR